jgi:hypothetical protein
VLGHTTGSHLHLPDEDESKLTIIWRAKVRDGRLTLLQIMEDTPVTTTNSVSASGSDPSHCALDLCSMLPQAVRQV